MIKDFLSTRNLVYSWDLFLELRSYSDSSSFWRFASMAIVLYVVGPELIFDFDLFLVTMRILGIVIGVGVQRLDCYNLFIGPI